MSRLPTQFWEINVQARYLTIKNFVVDQIEQGIWAPSEKIYSENELALKFSVSRMTARKAIDNLCSEGVLVRSQGLGTFVADTRPMSSLLEIRNIADEVVSRGHQYSCEIMDIQAVTPDKNLAILLELPNDFTVYHSSIVHFENDLAVQYEDRYINPKFAPDYLGQNFLDQTPNAYLSKVAPLTEADHIVEAIIPDKKITRALNSTYPCLKVTRRTWCKGGIVSVAYLYHPGDKYRLGGHLTF
ncbi:MAG: GntR family histidine utilization transcriptional repressor [Candidatus Azotimanducaceae bacterium]|jgi:GntR family histidine utilization transcriptional repressor